MMKKIGKYKIEKVISEGGAAATYRAHEAQLDRDVLLKVLHPSLSKDERSVERFSREAKAVARIRHAGIVHVYDYGKADDLYYIAMEFVDGAALSEILEREKSLPVDVATCIIYYASKALGFAHSQGIVHRDVKPGNILLANDGVVKVTDFGLAYSENLPSITIDGELFGTPSYMSPEQIKGEKMDARTDIYSLGLTFYQMISGTKPFEGDNYSAIITKKLTEDVVPLKKIVPDCPQKIANIISRMIERNPEKRYQSMEALGDDLELLAKESGLSLDEKVLLNFLGGKREGVLPSVSPRRRMRLGKPLILAGAIVVVLAGAVVLAVRLKSDRPADVAIPPEPPVDTTLTPAPVAETKKGYVYVSSVPQGALILVDGIAHESKTPALISELAQGNHQLALVLEGYERLTQRVSVQADETLRASFDLRPAEGPGFLKMNAAPWAAVYIDGDSVDTTPFNRLLTLDSGRHKIVLSNPDFPSFVMYTEISRGETTSVSIDLKNEFGYLTLNVDPWADVYIDGEYRDTTPLAKPIPLLPGVHLVRLIGPSSSTWEKRLTLERGKTIVETVVLPPG
jgi:serine/threonine-protein kinase